MSARRRRRSGAKAEATDSPAGPATPPAADARSRALATKGELYERYRDALRGGHLAAMQGDRDVAARAYLEAAALLPDRAAPYVGLGRVELAAGRADAALEAFEAALQRAPGDGPALEGAIRALLAEDRRPEAADMLDRLAITHLEQDRRADAQVAIERAAELLETPWRRSALDRLRAGQGLGDADMLDRPAGAGPGRAPRPRPTDARAGAPAATAIPAELRALAERVEAAGAADDVQGLVRGALALAGADRLRAAMDACHDALSVAPADPDVHRALAAIYRRRGWQAAARLKVALVDRYLAAVDDPHELDRLADVAESTGDVAAMLRIVDSHAARRRYATALELCFRALVLAPADAGLHLSIARLHLALGWRRRAVDEVTRLARLVELTDDTEGLERVATFVNNELRATPGSVTTRP